jgi:aminopeptidase YwaD
MRTRRRLFDVLSSELSGDRAVEFTRQLTKFYRSIGSSGYHQATNLVGEVLNSFGIRTERETYPLDGKTVYTGTRMPLAWEPIGAELSMVSPSVEHLVSYDEAPGCLIWWSTSTPAGGSVYEVVSVGTGQSETDYAGKNVQGKVIFAQGTAETDSWESWGQAAELAARRGARGVITDYLIRQSPPDRTRENLPEAVQLLRFPAELTGIWGLSVNYVASQKLAAALVRGPVRVFANVQCRSFVGEGVNLTGIIEGQELPHESVYFCAHVTAATKPGASCAEGVALAIEIARTLQSLIVQGQLRRPRRSIKFLFLAEQRGSAFLFDRHPQAARDILMCFNFCSVGASQSKLRSVLMFYRVPDSIPSFVNDFCATMMQEVQKEISWVGRRDPVVPLVSFVDVPYIARSDNGIWNQRKVPTPLIWSSPNPYFHTQFLTADNSDPRVFRRAGLVTAATAYEVADAGEERALEMLLQIRSRSTYRMSQVAARAFREWIDLRSGVDVSEDWDPFRPLSEIGYIRWRDTAVAESIMQLVRNDGDDVRQQIAKHVKTVGDDLTQAAEDQIRLLQSDIMRIPARGS